MAKILARTEILSTEYIACINKLYNGNTTAFYDAYLTENVSRDIFYIAMRMEPVTKQVVTDIELAVTYACSRFGVDMDDLNLIPDIETLIHLVMIRIKALESVEDVASLKELSKYLNFYSILLQRGIVKFERGKKTILTNKLYYHHWYSKLPQYLWDIEYLEKEAKLKHELTTGKIDYREGLKMDKLGIPYTKP